MELWKLNFRSLVAGLVLTALSGCASDPAPNYFNGGYYMAGDPSCVRMSAFGKGRIMCYNSSGAATGYRDEMTPEHMQMYQYQQINQQAQMQQFGQQLQQTGQSFQQSAQQTYQQSQQYVAPQVMPIAPPGGNQVNCINAGIHTNCRY